MITEAKAYMVVSEYDDSILNRRVTNLLKQGWVLYGPMVMAAENDSNDPAALKAQALVRLTGLTLVDGYENS